LATTGLPDATAADLSRVTKSLETISHRWSVWVLMTLSAGPQRYTEIKRRLPSWLHDGQIHPRLRNLTDAGLVERTEYDARHVSYGLTERGTALLPVLTVIAAWGNTHLEKNLVRNRHTGQMEPERIPAAQNIEDTLVLITPRHATAILWVLQARGASSALSLAGAAMPGYHPTGVHPRLRRLVADGLVKHADGSNYQLSAQGRALAPAYRALSAWAAGRPLTDAETHPVWGTAAAPSRSAPGTWVTNQPRQAHVPLPPPVPQAPDLTTQPQAASWRSGDLFSHQIPARPISPAGGPRR
jgi:DNA-binding HxlR family transcriptional regulator